MLRRFSSRRPAIFHLLRVTARKLPLSLHFYQIYSGTGRRKTALSPAPFSGRFPRAGTPGSNLFRYVVKTPELPSFFWGAFRSGADGEGWKGFFAQSVYHLLNNKFGVACRACKADGFIVREDICKLTPTFRGFNRKLNASTAVLITLIERCDDPFLS